MYCMTTHCEGGNLCDWLWKYCSSQHSLHLKLLSFFFFVALDLHEWNELMSGTAKNQECKFFKENYSLIFCAVCNDNFGIKNLSNVWSATHIYFLINQGVKSLIQLPVKRDYRTALNRPYHNLSMLLITVEY